MTEVYISMPLYSDQDYRYQISLEGNTYVFRVYYNARMQLWMMDLSLENGSSILSGVGLVPNYLIAEDYALPDLTGFFYLEPIENINTERYKTNPTSLAQYYRLFYIYNLED